MGWMDDGMDGRMDDIGVDDIGMDDGMDDIGMDGRWDGWTIG